MNQALGVLNTNGLQQALTQGLVARAYPQDGVWWLERKGENMSPTDAKVVEGDLPWFGFEWSGMVLTLLQNNPEWARHNEPIGPHLYQRIYYFVGNTPEQIGDDIKMWRIGVSNTNEAPSNTVTIGAPCRIQVRPQPEKVNAGWEAFLNGANTFFDNVVYGDDFVDEEDRHLLQPENFLTAVSNYVADLSTLNEVFHTKAEHIQGYNPIGPLVILKGRVTDINAEGWDSEYSTDKTYPIRIPSFALQRAFPSGLGSNISVRLHQHLKEENHGFEYNNGQGWAPYALKSTVIVFGRLGLTKRDDGEYPRLNCLGIYVVPSLAIPAGDGGNNTNLSQFNENASGGN